MSKRAALLQILLFLALTLLLSSIFYALIIATGHTGGAKGAYATGLMWCPGIAALLTCRISGLSFASLGWAWGAWRWQVLAYVIPLAYVAAAYTFVWRFGFAAFDPAFVAWARKNLGWTAASDAEIIWGWFALTATTGLVAAVAHALGEEIGWRGFLAPRMHEMFGFAKGAAMTGAVWAAWHLPILVFADYNSGTPWWFAMTCFTVMVVGMSITMAWLRLTSGSLWTAAIFHASHNLFIQSFFTPATADRGAITHYSIDEFGFAVPAASLVIAGLVLFHATRRNVRLAAIAS